MSSLENLREDLLLSNQYILLLSNQYMSQMFVKTMFVTGTFIY